MVSRRKRFLVRWHRAGMGLRLLVFVLAAVLFSVLVYISRPDDETGTSASLVLFTLVNLNVVILCLLAFLIGRNIVKLVFDRRRGILGAKLRMRLVVAFVGLTLIPSTLVFFLASGLLTQAMEGWFSSQIETAIDGAVEVSRQHLETLKTQVRTVAKHLGSQLEKQPRLLRESQQLTDWLENERQAWGLFSVRVLQGQREIALARSAAAEIENFREPDPSEEILAAAALGTVRTRVEERGAGRFLRCYFPLSEVGPSDRMVLVVTARAEAELIQALDEVTNSFREYEELKLLKQPLASGYILTLAMITGLLIFSAIWVAFYIARELVVPLQRLAEGTKSIARGAYDIRIREVGDDELGVLVKSFNQMIEDLKTSRDESERRRILIETIISNLAVGVLTLDTEGKISAINSAAGRMLRFPEGKSMLGLALTEVFSAEQGAELSGLIESVKGRGEANSTASIEKPITLESGGSELKVVCTAGRILDPRGNVQGYVLLLDNVTELLKAQQLAAWREVAQRIAHEIKNPLTPIQLSAQRLAKLFSGVDAPTLDSAVREKVSEYADTIVAYVDSIKRLANEFSQFSRMPRAEMQASNLNQVISSLLDPYAVSHSHIVFQFIADNSLPPVMLDREQIRRMLINLIENAIAAVDGVEGRAIRGLERPRITIKTHAPTGSSAGGVVVEVSDNGPGIRSELRAKVFEPYFTTRKGGTGLGLAIVTSIVEEHQGKVRYFQNEPHGARFEIEIPIKQRSSARRRFAGTG